MSTYYSREEALAEAAKFGLEMEVEYLMNHGYTPDEALREWDCTPNEEEL